MEAPSCGLCMQTMDKVIEPTIRNVPRKGLPWPAGKGLARDQLVPLQPEALRTQSGRDQVHIHGVGMAMTSRGLSRLPVLHKGAIAGRFGWQWRCHTRCRFAIRSPACVDERLPITRTIERTREIGIRKAIGAKKREILEQFLIESVVISFLGGGIGVLMGIAISKMVSNIGGWETIVSTQSILLAFGFSVGIGIFFGFYPANKAANMNPIEALRYE